jgi:hypothetical protein
VIERARFSAPPSALENRGEEKGFREENGEWGLVLKCDKKQIITVLYFNYLEE